MRLAPARRPRSDPQTRRSRKMSLRVSVAFAMVAAAAVLAAAGTSNRSTDQGAAPSPSPAAQDIRCNAMVDGVHYSVERCNKTNKTVLKVFIKDEYKLTVPPSPTPTQPATTTESPEEVPSDEFGMLYEEELPTWLPDMAEEDWDYIEQAADGSPEVKKIVRTEERRHPTKSPRPGPVFSPHSYRPYEDFSEFCHAAAQEDEEPVLMLDGSFHPKYEEVPGVGVYRLHAKARTWADARRVCEREGAQLAVPNSREEAVALVDLHNRCPDLLPTHFNDYQYLGVHDDYGEGNWETIVGYPLNETGYMNWAFNQPDNAHEKGENCLTMNRNAFFNDVPCWTELPFICEHV